MSRRRTAAWFILAALAGAPELAYAVLPQEMLADPAQEERARTLSRDLRCQVCQNQSIDDSDAPLAADLRRLVRERIVAGDGDGQIVDFLVQRYGDNVLLRPPMKPATWPLWFGPLVAFLLATLGVLVYLRRRASAIAPPQALAPEEERRLHELVNEDGDPEAKDR